MFQENYNFSERENKECYLPNSIGKKVPDDFEIIQVLFYSLIQKRHQSILQGLYLFSDIIGFIDVQIG